MFRARMHVSVLLSLKERCFDLFFLLSKRVSFPLDSSCWWRRLIEEEYSSRIGILIRCKRAFALFVRLSSSTIAKVIVLTLLNATTVIWTCLKRLFVSTRLVHERSVSNVNWSRRHCHSSSREKETRLMASSSQVEPKIAHQTIGAYPRSQQLSCGRSMSLSFQEKQQEFTLRKGKHVSRPSSNFKSKILVADEATWIQD